MGFGRLHAGYIVLPMDGKNKKDQSGGDPDRRSSKHRHLLAVRSCLLDPRPCPDYLK
jgi:hypothetical protein